MGEYSYLKLLKGFKLTKSIECYFIQNTVRRVFLERCNKNSEVICFLHEYKYADIVCTRFFF